MARLTLFPAAELARRMQAVRFDHGMPDDLLTFDENDSGTKPGSPEDKDKFDPVNYMHGLFISFTDRQFLKRFEEKIASQIFETGKHVSKNVMPVMRALRTSMSFANKAYENGVKWKHPENFTPDCQLVTNYETLLGIIHKWDPTFSKDKLCRGLDALQAAGIIFRTKGKPNTGSEFWRISKGGSVTYIRINLFRINKVMAHGYTELLNTNVKVASDYVNPVRQDGNVECVEVFDPESKNTLFFGRSLCSPYTEISGFFSVHRSTAETAAVSSAPQPPASAVPPFHRDDVSPVINEEPITTAPLAQPGVPKLLEGKAEELRAEGYELLEVVGYGSAKQPGYQQDVHLLVSENNDQDDDRCNTTLLRCTRSEMPLWRYLCDNLTMFSDTAHADYLPFTTFLKLRPIIQQGRLNLSDFEAYCSGRSLFPEDKRLVRSFESIIKGPKAFRAHAHSIDANFNAEMNEDIVHAMPEDMPKAVTKGLEFEIGQLNDGELPDYLKLDELVYSTKAAPDLVAQAAFFQKLVPGGAKALQTRCEDNSSIATRWSNMGCEKDKVPVPFRNMSFSELDHLRDMWRWAGLKFEWIDMQGNIWSKRCFEHCLFLATFADQFDVHVNFKGAHAVLFNQLRPHAQHHMDTWSKDSLALCLFKHDQLPGSKVNELFRVGRGRVAMGKRRAVQEHVALQTAFLIQSTI